MADALPMTGRIALVTGATQGIGRETALGLARLGARVGLVGRERRRTDDAVAWVRANAPGALAEGFVADLALQSGVRALAAEVGARFPALHVLVNNAGALFTTRAETAEGIEQTLALNHLGYFLFTGLLLPLLERSAPARVVNVASDAHGMARLDLDDLHWRRRRYRGMAVYGTTKLMNLLFTRELARRLAGTGVTANCLHPGVIGSGFGHNNRGLFGLLVKVGRPFLASNEKGARTSIWAASAPELEGITGDYFKDQRRGARCTRTSRDPELALRLWEASERLVAPVEPANLHREAAK